MSIYQHRPHAKNAAERKQRRREARRRYEQSAKGHANWLRYRRRLRQRLVLQFGGKCADCAAVTNLQFAHIKPTPIIYTKVGRKGERCSAIGDKAKDIRAHPDCYRLLCVLCHELFDRGRNGFKGQQGSFRREK